MIKHAKCEAKLYLGEIKGQIKTSQFSSKISIVVEILIGNRLFL